MTIADQERKQATGNAVEVTRPGGADKETRLVYACPECGRGGWVAQAGPVRCRCGSNFDVRG